MSSSRTKKSFKPPTGFRIRSHSHSPSVSPSHRSNNPFLFGKTQINQSETLLKKPQNRSPADQDHSYKGSNEMSDKKTRAPLGPSHQSPAKLTTQTGQRVSSLNLFPVIHIDHPITTTNRTLYGKVILPPSQERGRSFSLSPNNKPSTTTNEMKQGERIPVSDQSQETKRTLAHMETNYHAQLARAVLEKKEDKGLCGFSEQEKNEWIVDTELWTEKVDPKLGYEYELNQNKFSSLCKTSPSPKSHGNSPSSQSPSKTEGETDRGNYLYAHFESVEFWIKLRNDKRVVEKLEFPLIFRKKEEFIDVLMILKERMHANPIERRLCGNVEWRIIPLKMVDQITRQKSFRKKENPQKLVRKEKLEEMKSERSEGNFGETNLERSSNIIEEMANVFVSNNPEPAEFTFGQNLFQEIKASKKKKYEGTDSGKKMVKITPSSGENKENQIDQTILPYHKPQSAQTSEENTRDRLPRMLEADTVRGDGSQGDRAAEENTPDVRESLLGKIIGTPRKMLRELAEFLKK